MCRNAASIALVLAVLAGLPAAAATAKVTYVSGSTVYIAAGTADGLPAGLRLEVEGPSSTIVLESFEATPHRAACRVVEGQVSDVRVGDAARWEASAVMALAPAQAQPEAATHQPSGLRGRVGIRYLATRDGLNERAEFQQPALDLRLDAPSMYGTPWGFQVDLRARRTLRSEGEDENRNRVYALYGAWDRPGQGWRVGLGRQYAPELANVSVFDGAQAAWDGVKWTFGGFAGTQPDGEDYGYSTDVREAGAFAGRRGQAGGSSNWSIGGGVVGSYQESEVNREYLYVLGRWTSPRVGAFLTQEVDINRGWKTDAGESSLEPTSTFASVRVTATSWLDLYAGYDNRRDVRLYRDYVSPETEFDDEFRRGLWAGAAAGLGEHVRLGLYGRSYDGGDAGSADSYTATFGVDRMTRADLAFRLRGTVYENDRLEGNLYAADVATNLGSHVRLGVEAGLREDDSLLNPNLSDEVLWYGALVDFDLGRHLWSTLSYDHSDGDYEDVDQLYATLAYRF